MCKKLCSLAILVVMLAALPVWAGGKQDKKASEGFATVTDHQGSTVVIPKKPERIVAPFYILSLLYFKQRYRHILCHCRNYFFRISMMNRCIDNSRFFHKISR